MRWERQRGQTLPVWALGTLSIMLLMFYTLNYANVITWQIRAQNAADAAAQGALSIQATQWNEMLMLLYASSVEEFRARRDLDGMLLALNHLGNCDDSGTSTDCATVYNTLHTNYENALARYTADVSLMNRVTAAGSSAQFAEMSSAVAQFQTNGCANANAANAGDCAFTYTLVNPRLRNDSYLEDTFEYATSLIVGYGTQANPKADLTPGKIEVITCANVPPIIPDFFKLHAQTFKAIGRAAATTMQVTQEWMAPGHYVNPAPWGDGQYFQSTEYPETTTNAAAFGTSAYDWYSVEYGSDTYQAFPSSLLFQSNTTGDEFSVMTGWWSSIPIRPYSGTLIAGSDFQCK